MGKTSIEWTVGPDGSAGKTWNPIRGCSRISPGCQNCYAEKIAVRFSEPGMPFHGFASRETKRWTGKLSLLPEKLKEPGTWRQPSRVFVNSMSDLFHEHLPFEDIADVYRVMQLAPKHTFQILTKRPARRLEFFRWMETTDIATGGNLRDEGQWPCPNIWEGVSVENQQHADERIPMLLSTPAAIRFVSYEPALGPVNFSHGWYCPPLYHLHEGPSRRTCADPDLIIVGGESGPNARPFDLAWARSTVAQCREASIACFVKQIGTHPIFGTGLEGGPQFWPAKDKKGGAPMEWPEDLRVREFPGGAK